MTKFQNPNFNIGASSKTYVDNWDSVFKKTKDTNCSIKDCSWKTEEDNINCNYHLKEEENSKLPNKIDIANWKLINIHSKHGIKDNKNLLTPEDEGEVKDRTEELKSIRDFLCNKHSCSTHRYINPVNKITDLDINNNPNGVEVLVVTKDKQVVITKQFRGGPNKVTSEFPSGKIDGGETIYDAAKREVLEETGYTVGNLIYIGFHQNPYSTAKMHYFIGENSVKNTEQSLSATEFIEIELHDLRTYITNNLNDKTVSKSILTIAAQTYIHSIYSS